VSDIDVLPVEGAAHEGAFQPEADIFPGVHRTHAGDAGHARQRPTVIDLPSYLQDISADQPCGPDLQYDADYIELARIMQGTPEVEYGGMRIEAADPDWKMAKTLALKLLARTRDLRLAVWLARILMGQHGFAGLDDGLALIEAFIDRCWDRVHPVIEPDDDPIERLNILVALDDMDGLLRQVRVAALARSAMYGQVCLRDVDIASGELPPRPDEKASEPATIEAIFDTADLSGLETLADVMEQAAARLDHIETLLVERLGQGWATGVEKLPATLRHAVKVVRAHLSRRPGNATASVTPHDGPYETSTVDAAQAPAGLNGEVASREDVARQIDRICEYYASVEPGSPVPILLQRAKRLINMTFIELMSELSPQGLAEISFLVGHRPQVTHSDGRDVGSLGAGAGSAAAGCGAQVPGNRQ